MTDRQKPSESLPELVQDWADIAYEVLTKEGGIPADRARLLADQCAFRIAEEHGGRSLYLAKCAVLKLHRQLNQRDQAIMADFNGHNFLQLAQKHQVTDRHVRRLVKRSLAIDLKKRQTALFPNDPGSIPNRR